jgi:membrane protein insertase Oxa1/YidC/SpoIIIJ
MKIFFPILFVYFCLVSSTALAIYWTTSSLCMILVNFIINKVLDARDKKKELEGEK